MRARRVPAVSLAWNIEAFHVELPEIDDRVYSVTERELGVDAHVDEWLNKRRCFDARPYLSWIEDLTTNQGVVGSNPTGRATQLKAVLRTAFFI